MDTHPKGELDESKSFLTFSGDHNPLPCVPIPLQGKTTVFPGSLVKSNKHKQLYPCLGVCGSGQRMVASGSVSHVAVMVNLSPSLGAIHRMANGKWFSPACWKTWGQIPYLPPPSHMNEGESFLLSGLWNSTKRSQLILS